VARQENIRFTFEANSQLPEVIRQLEEINRLITQQTQAVNANSAQTNSTINAQISAQSRLNTQIASTSDGIQKVGVTAQNTNNVLRSTASLLGAAFAISSIGGFIEKIFTAQSAVEMFKNTLGNLVGIQAGSKIEADLKKLVSTTPLQFESATKNVTNLLFAYKQLEAETGKSYIKDVVKDYEALGNVARGNVDILNRLVYVFTQGAAARKVQGNDWKQFSEAQIPIMGLLAKSMGITTEAVEKLKKEGGITFDQMRKALIEAGSAGGLFAGQMDIAAKTVRGIWSNMVDAMFFAFSNIGNYFANNAKSALAWGIDVSTALFGTEQATARSIMIVKDLIGTWIGYQVVTKASIALEAIARASKEAMILVDGLYLRAKLLLAGATSAEILQSAVLTIAQNNNAIAINNLTVALDRETLATDRLLLIQANLGATIAEITIADAELAVATSEVSIAQTRLITTTGILAEVQLGGATATQVLTVAESEAIIATNGLKISMGAIAIVLGIAYAAYEYYNSISKESTAISDKLKGAIDEETKKYVVQKETLGNLVTQYKLANGHKDEQNRLLVKMEQVYPGFLKNLKLDGDLSAELAVRLAMVNKELERKIKLSAGEAINKVNIDNQVKAYQELLNVGRELTKINPTIKLPNLTDVNAINSALNKFQDEKNKAFLSTNQSGFGFANGANKEVEALETLRSTLSKYNVTVNEGFQARKYISEQNSANYKKETADIEANYNKQIKAGVSSVEARRTYNESIKALNADYYKDEVATVTKAETAKTGAKKKGVQERIDWDLVGKKSTLDALEESGAKEIEIIKAQTDYDIKLVKERYDKQVILEKANGKRIAELEVLAGNEIAVIKKNAEDKITQIKADSVKERIDWGLIEKETTLKILTDTETIRELKYKEQVDKIESQRTLDLTMTKAFFNKLVIEEKAKGERLAEITQLAKDAIYGINFKADNDLLLLAKKNAAGIQLKKNQDEYWKDTKALYDKLGKEQKDFDLDKLKEDKVAYLAYLKQKKEQYLAEMLTFEVFGLTFTKEYIELKLKLLGINKEMYALEKKETDKNNKEDIAELRKQNDYIIKENNAKNRQLAKSDYVLNVERLAEQTKSLQAELATIKAKRDTGIKLSADELQREKTLSKAIIDIRKQLALATINLVKTTYQTTSKIITDFYDTYLKSSEEVEAQVLANETLTVDEKKRLYTDLSDKRQEVLYSKAQIEKSQAYFTAVLDNLTNFSQQYSQIDKQLKAGEIERGQANAQKAIATAQAVAGIIEGIIQAQTTFEINQLNVQKQALTEKYNLASSLALSSYNTQKEAMTKFYDDEIARLKKAGLDTVAIEKEKTEKLAGLYNNYTNGKTASDKAYADAQKKINHDLFELQRKQQKQAIIFSIITADLQIWASAAALSIPTLGISLIAAGVLTALSAVYLANALSDINSTPNPYKKGTNRLTDVEVGKRPDGQTGGYIIEAHTDEAILTAEQNKKLNYIGGDEIVRRMAEYEGMKSQTITLQPKFIGRTESVQHFSYMMNNTSFEKGFKELKSEVINLQKSIANMPKTEISHDERGTTIRSRSKNYALEKIGNRVTI